MTGKISLIAALLAAVLPCAAHAEMISDLQLADGTSGSPIVTISYSNPDGTGHNSASVYADPIVSGGTKTPVFYCVDLWHDNYLGSSYKITPTSSISYATGTYADVDNRLAWLVSQPQTTADQRGAVQLAMWYAVDKNSFSFTGGDANLRSDYNNLISFAGYNSMTDYAANFWNASHVGTLYQDLISACPVGSTTSTSTHHMPEPNSLALAGLGFTVLGGFTAFRRRLALV